MFKKEHGILQRGKSEDTPESKKGIMYSMLRCGRPRNGDVLNTLR